MPYMMLLFIFGYFNANCYGQKYCSQCQGDYCGLCLHGVYSTSQKIQNCAEYYMNSSQCQACEFGFFRNKEGNCVECSIKGCAYCPEDQCKTCFDGRINTIQSCDEQFIQCNLLNCDICTTEGDVCVKCKQNYSLNSNLQCVTGLEGCQQLENDQSKCHICQPGYFLEKDLQCYKNETYKISLFNTIIFWSFIVMSFLLFCYFAYLFIQYSREEEKKEFLNKMKLQDFKKILDQLIQRGNQEAIQIERVFHLLIMETKIQISHSKTCKPQRFLVNSISNKKLLRENKLKSQSQKLLVVDNGFSNLDPIKIQTYIQKKILFQKRSVNPVVIQKKKLSQSSKLLYSQIFLDNLKVQNQNEVILSTQQNGKKIPDFDEGLQIIKEVTKKEANYEIYDLIQEKKEANKNRNKMKKQNSLHLTSTLQHQNQFITNEQKNTFLETKSYFSQQIMFEIPNIFNLNKDSLCIPGFDNQNFNQKILRTFNKQDILIKMKTNFLKKADNHEFQLLFYLALTFENEKNYQKAIEYFNKFLKYVVQLDNTDCVSFCYNRLGINQFKLKNYDLACDFHKKCLENSSEQNQFIAIYNFAHSLRYLNHYQESIQFNEQCLQWAQERVEKQIVCISLAQIGINYFYLNDLELSFQFLQNALSYSEYVSEQIRLDLLMYVSLVQNKDNLKNENTLEKAINYAEEIQKEDQKNTCKISLGIMNGEEDFENFKNSFHKQLFK